MILKFWYGSVWFFERYHGIFFNTIFGKNCGPVRNQYSVWGGLAVSSYDSQFKLAIARLLKNAECDYNRSSLRDDVLPLFQTYISFNLQPKS